MALPGELDDPFGLPPDPVAAWSGPVPLPPEWELPPGTLPSPFAPPPPAPAVEAPQAALPPEPQAQPAAPPSSAPGADLPPPSVPAPAATPAPELPVPDAVSAADALPDLAPTSAVPETPLPYMDASELANRSPEEIALLDNEQESERARIGIDAKAEALRRDRERLADNERIYQEAQAKTQATYDQLMAESKALADQKGGFEGLSTRQQIGGFVAAIFGGLLQGKTGSATNTGMDMLNKIIDRADAERREKRADLKDRMAATAQGFGRNADAFRHSETFRQAMYEQAAREIETQMQQYDPQGTTAIRGAKEVQKIRAAAAASARKFLIEERDYNLKVATHNLEARKAEQAQKQHSQSQALGWARLGFDQKKEARDAAKDERDYNLRVRDVLAKEAEETRKRAEAEAAADRQLGIGGEVRERIVKQEVADPVTGKVSVKDVKVYDVDQLRNPDNTVFRAPSEVAQQALIKQRSGTQDLIDALGDLKRLRQRAGGADKYTSPDDQAEYDRLTNKATIAYATAKGLSLADKSSTDFARDAILGGDPSSYRAGDTERRIEATIVDATRSYHTALKGQGYKGKLPSFERRLDDAPLSSAEGASKEVLKHKTPSERAADAEPGVVGNVLEHVFYPLGGRPSDAKAEAAMQSGSIDIPGLSIEQEKATKALVRQAKSTELDERAVNDARQQLVNLASDPKREALHAPILKYLELEAPDLFEAAVKKLPTEEREQWTNYAELRKGWTGGQQ